MFRNRVTELLGVDIPIVQAPMGWIARSDLASAVSNAGAMGIIETSSGELDVIRDEIRRMRDLTDKPFGVNIAQAFVRDPSIVEFVVEQGVTFVTTSAGSPTRYTAQLKEAGLTVFHVVPTLRAAQKAADAGVDGLIVEGGEGGGFKNPQPVASMVLLPLVVSKIDLPVIAAGGFVDGPTMAAAFALGAEGIQLGTRMVSARRVAGPRELEADHRRRRGDRHGLPQPARQAGAARPAHRLHERTRVRPRAERHGAVRQRHRRVLRRRPLAGIALGGQVAGRIDSVRPVADIISECARDCLATIDELARRYPS